MPAIDYSRFDNIDDSDEEPAPAAQLEAPAALRRAATPAGPVSKAPNGRELLEPVGLDEKLCFASPAPAASGGRGAAQPGPPDPMASLAEQLERWAAPSGGSSASGAGGGSGALQAQQEPQRKSAEPQRLCVRADGLKKIHTTFPDGAEMVEEYDERTDVLITRKTKRAGVLGREMQWEYEVGQAPVAAFDPHSDMLRASSSNPIFLRKDTPEHFQWRVRNLPYPADVYSVTVDHEKQQIVVRTSNKKYFKRIDVPDLRRADEKLTLKDELLTWRHQHNTLIISYTKPQEVTAAELKVLKESEKAALAM